MEGALRESLQTAANRLVDGDWRDAYGRPVRLTRVQKVFVADPQWPSTVHAWAKHPGGETGYLFKFINGEWVCDQLRRSVEQLQLPI